MLMRTSSILVFSGEKDEDGDFVDWKGRIVGIKGCKVNLYTNNEF